MSTTPSSTIQRNDLTVSTSARLSNTWMSDCCLQGIQPCECKRKWYKWVGNQVFRLGSRIEWDLQERDLQKPFGEFKTVNSILLTKYCSHRTEISTKDIVTVFGGKWHRPNRFGQLFFKIMNPREPWIRNSSKKYISDSNTVNNMKLKILTKIRVIHSCSSSPRAASVWRTAQTISGNSPTLHTTVPSTIIVELHLDSVFWFGIGWYIFSVFYQPIPKENSVRIFRYYVFGGDIPINDPNSTAILNNTDKNNCAFALRTMTHGDLIKRGRASCLPTWFPTRLPPKKTQHEPILVFDLPLAHPAAFFNSDTEKIMRSHSKMTHDDFFKRGCASCSSIPTRPPKKRLSTNQFAGAPSSQIYDMLAAGARK